MAPDETPDVVETSGPSPEEALRGLQPADPRKLTGRERRRRLILLAILILLLLLLGCITYYYAQNRRMPKLGIAPARTDLVAPPEYLYSIVGNGASAMVRPVGVGVAENGRVYVVDFGNRRVSVFTNPGAYLFSFNATADGTLINPVHLVIRGGEVWVSDRYFHTIYVFDLDGHYLRKFEPKNETLDWTPLAFSFDSTGALRVTDVGNTKLHRLIFFSPDGSRTVTIGKTAQVNSVEEEPGSFLFPNGVVVAANGEVFVADGDNRRVQVFTPDGQFSRFIDTSGVPRGIAMDDKDRLYVVDALSHLIAVFNSKGAMLVKFGERGFGPGQFNYPNDIAVDKRDRIYITDRENNQVQVWGWPAAQITLPPAAKQWPWLLLCCIPLLFLPLLLLRRLKTRIVVTPEFMSGLEEYHEIRAISEQSRLRLVAPVEDLPLYRDRMSDGIVLTDLLTFEDYSESDARALMDRLRIGLRPAMLLAMAMRAKALGTDDQDMRLLAMVAEVRTVDVAEFREIYLKRDSGSSEAGRA